MTSLLDPSLQRQRPESAVTKRFGPDPEDINIQEIDFETEPVEEGGVPTDELGRIEEPEELKKVDKVHEEAAKSIFVKLGIVLDEERAKALATVLRGKTPKSVIKTRVGKGGQKFSYVEGWYIKRMLNALFAMQWDFELQQVREGEFFYMNSQQVIVIGKLTVRDTSGNPRIVKVGVGKKDISYLKDANGRRSTTPVDLGNEIKAAETDALKRCATSLGIALDLYMKED